MLGFPKSSFLHGAKFIDNKNMANLTFDFWCSSHIHTHKKIHVALWQFLAQLLLPRNFIKHSLCGRYRPLSFQITWRLSGLCVFSYLHHNIPSTSFVFENGSMLITRFLSIKHSSNLMKYKYQIIHYQTVSPELCWNLTLVFKGCPGHWYIIAMMNRK